MTVLVQWLTQQKKSQEQAVSVYSALLGIQPQKYLNYRLRYFIWNSLISLFVHVVEFYLLMHFFKQQYFISILAFRVLALVIQGGWWGALEILRTRVRYFALEKNKMAISDEIKHWMMLAGIVSGCIFLVGLPYLMQTIKHTGVGQLELFDFYVFVILFQLMCQVVVRAFHSGGYALKRIYRPFYTVSGPQIIGALILVAGWPLIGQWSLPLSFFVTSLFALSWTTYYTMRLYRIMRYTAMTRFKHQTFLQFLKNIPLRELSWSAVGSMLLSAEGMLLLVLLPRNQDILTSSFLLFYLISPLIRASFDWSRLFYFDLKRFENPLLRKMIKQFNYSTFVASIWIGLFCWVLCIPLMYLLPSPSVTVMGILLLFFVLRTRLGFAQLVAFCERRYFDVFLSGSVMIVAAFVLQQMHSSLTAALLSLVATSILSLLYLKWIKTSAIVDISPPDLPEFFYLWLRQLKSVQSRVRVTLLQLPQRNIGGAARHLKLKLAKILNCEGEVSCLDKSTVLLYQKLEGSTTNLQPATLFPLGSGLIEDISSLEEDSGVLAHEAAKKNIWQQPHRPNIYNKNLAEETANSTVVMAIPRDHAELLQTFKQFFPEGHLIDLSKNIFNTGPSAFVPEDAQEIFSQLMWFLRIPLEKQLNKAFFVCAEIQQGQVSTIFVVKKGQCTRLDFFKWQECVHAYNCANE